MNDAGGGRIEIRGLHKTYGGPSVPVEVLRGLDMDVPSGGMVAVVGDSGVGKTTLLHILGALDRPTKGTVLYDGEDVYSRSDSELDRFRNRKVGFVFQFHHLIGEFSALENVAMPALVAGERLSRVEPRCRELMARLGVDHRADHRPGELSGGEQQRIAVARALVMEPSVLLADEPTGNLDHATGDRLFGLIEELHETLGLTVVTVTHNERLAARMPMEFRLQNGTGERIR